MHHIFGIIFCVRDYTNLEMPTMKTRIITLASVFAAVYAACAAEITP